MITAAPAPGPHHDAVWDFFVALSQVVHAHLHFFVLLTALVLLVKVSRAISGAHRRRAVSRFRAGDLDWPGPPRRIEPPKPKRPADKDGIPHHESCPCAGCRAFRDAQAGPAMIIQLPPSVSPAELAAAIAAARGGGPMPVAVMPEPSDDIEPAGPSSCRHDHGIARVVAGGVLQRYTCGSPWCSANWPPSAEFPAGTVILPDRDDGR